jgi:hypothetical protein
MSERPKRSASSTTKSGGSAAGGGTAVLTGPGFRRQDFIKNYANMVARTWIDDRYLDLILADPPSALSKAGLPTPAGATVRVVQMKISGMGQMTDQVDAWVAGNRTGLFDLYLPLKPDDMDIEEGGGVPVDGCAGGASCCCTPCCCCT